MGPMYTAPVATETSVGHVGPQPIARPRRPRAAVTVAGPTPRPMTPKPSTNAGTAQAPLPLPDSPDQNLMGRYRTITSESQAPAPQPTGYADSAQTPPPPPGSSPTQGIVSHLKNAVSRARAATLPTPPTAPPPLPPSSPSPPPAPGLTDATFLPGGDTRLTDAQDATDAAAKSALNGSSVTDQERPLTEQYRSLFGSGDVQAPGVNTSVTAGAAPDPNAESGRFRSLSGQQDAAVAGLDNGQTRFDAARGTLQNLEDSIGRQRTAGIREIGQANAALGRLGSGMTTNDLSGLEQSLADKRNATLRDLSASTTEGDINDRFRRVDTVSGLRGQEEAIGATRRGELRSDRDYQTAVDTGNVDRGIAERDTLLRQANRNSDTAFDRDRSAVDLGRSGALSNTDNRYRALTAASGLEDQRFGQGRGNRDEYRTERQYQQGNNQQGFENRLRIRQQENAEQGSAFERAMAQAQMGAGNPSATRNAVLGSYDDAASGAAQTAYERALMAGRQPSASRRTPRRQSTGIDSLPGGLV